MNAAERTRRARAAAYARHSRCSGQESTAAMRAGFMAKWERQVDPDGTLDPAERQRRSQLALRSHMTTLAGRSAKARSRTETSAAPPTP